MSDALEDFDVAVLEESYDYILKDNLDLASKIEKAVKAGASPDQLARRFLGIAGEHRTPMAKRIENAAKYVQHLHAQKRGG